MGKKEKMLQDENVDDQTKLSEQIHGERRDEGREEFDKKAREEEKRAEKKGKKRVPVWIKQEVLDYEEELKKLQIELLKLQNHVKEKGLKMLIIFEGRDAAGKGGTIKRVTEHLNPRSARVVALNKPSDVEKTQWYFQRYVGHLPSAGEIVLFDRSWYNRAMVEPVLGFCTNEEHRDFLHEVPYFEQMLVNSGIILIKFYFSVSKEEEAKRFEERASNPLKQYKLSPIDQFSQTLWEKYTVAEYSMFLASHTQYAPWTIIDSDNKKKARINCIKSILSYIDYPDKIKKKKLKIDPSVIMSAESKIIEFDNSVGSHDTNHHK